MEMQTRIKINKDGQTLLDVSVDAFVFQMFLLNNRMPSLPFTIHVQSPLGDEIRLVTEDEDAE